MKKQEVLCLQKLSAGVGKFIRYWGFRNIHGEIWSVIYLSTQPLSGIEICEILRVSKALVSPALKELEIEGLIMQTQSENSKTKRYIAEEDVVKVIHSVLRRREMQMINRIQHHHAELTLKNINESGPNKAVNPLRLQKMGVMIQMAQWGLETLVNSEQIWTE